MKSPFFDSETVFSFSWLRVIYFNLFVAFFLITEIGRNIYRPYIYENNISDYGIADSIGNSAGVITQIFFALAIFHPNKIKGIRIIIFIVTGYLAYELVQPYLPRGTFDPNDIRGTAFGGVVAYLLFLLIHWGNTVINSARSPHTALSSGA